MWPAFLLFLAFVWGELLWERSAIPADLAGAALVYSAVTWSQYPMLVLMVSYTFASLWILAQPIVE